MKAIQKPITYEAEQCTSESTVADFNEVLGGSRVKVIQWKIGQFGIEHPAPSDVEMERIENIFLNDYLVVSSLGDVRVLNAEEYSEEFYEDWENPETPEDKIAFLAKYVNRLMEAADRSGRIEVSPGDWGKIERLQVPE